MSVLTERRARPGELCSCGRPAKVVFVIDDGEDVAWCGAPPEAARWYRQ